MLSLSVLGAFNERGDVVTEKQIEFMRQDMASNYALSKMIDVVKERLGDKFEEEFEKFKQEQAK